MSTGAADAAVRDVRVKLGDRSYTVRVGPGLLDGCGQAIADLATGSTVVLVTNPTVAALYLEPVVRSLAAAGVASPVVVEIDDGERFKNLATVESIYDRALDAGIDRSALVVALGGGVVGDVAGFAAATLLRGLRLVMLPTTLLAQVDSSVGGKTGVNRAHGKNLVGAFFQPSLVISDPCTLTTLPEREYRAGLAEVVKYGVILDDELFATLERESEAVVRRDAKLMADVVARCAEIKAGVVERDETEGDLRRILNFGHTVGHAVEKVTDYRRYLHGEAVALGMISATRVSRGLGACDDSVEQRLVSLLTRLGLEVGLPADLDRDELAAAVKFDKKSEGDQIAFIVCESIGRCRVQNLGVDAIRAAL